MKLVITMPVYNEAGSISSFYSDLYSVFNNKYNLYFIFVNDKSTDKTNSILNLIAEKNKKVNIINNSKNLGHGLSTLIGLREAIFCEPDLILNVDGDGNYFANELLEFTETFLLSGAQVGEGVRINRQDPIYRVLVTKIVSYLIKLNSGVKPKDANTPCRLFKPEKLVDFLRIMPPNATIPNLYFSTIIRKSNLNVIEYDINHHIRTGVNSLGVSWNNKFKNLPSKRFIKFSLQALGEWINYQRKY